MPTFPKYTEQKRKGNIGEAFVQYILSNFCLVHKIDGSYDIGNDFICELIKGNYPTNLLFYVQVKYGKDKPNIEPKTKNYWKSSPIPVYVFWVRPKRNSIPPIKDFSELELSYQRWTPVLHHPGKHKDERFKPFKPMDFYRDLFVDYVRTQYAKGSTRTIRPGDFLEIDWPFGGYRYVFYTKDLIPEYSREILSHTWTNLFTTAILLLRKGGKRNLREAKEMITLAKKSLRFANKRTGSIFIGTLQTYEKRINEAVRKLDEKEK